MLKRYRYHNVRELTVAAAHVPLGNTSWVKKVFFAPSVKGLEDLNTTSFRDDGTPSSTGAKPAASVGVVHPNNKKELSRPLEAAALTLLTYMRSHFCFEPPGTWRSGHVAQKCMVLPC